MTDIEFMRYAFKGNQAAVDYVLMIAEVANVWDNLIDRDVPVEDEEIHRAFWLLAVEIPRNPFYRNHIDELLPVTAMGILNWITANSMELGAGDARAIEIAHVIRYSIADVCLMAALVSGGREWAAQVGPELRMRSQRSDMSEYINSLQARGLNHGTTKTTI